MSTIKKDEFGFFGQANWSGTTKRLLPSLLEHGLVEAMLDLLEEGIVVHDESRKILLVNTATEKITGCSRGEILGRNCHDVFAPDGLCGAACAFKDGKEPHNVRRSHKVTFTRPDGEVKRIKVSSTRTSINAETTGVIAIVKDLTEMSNLRWQLDKHREFHGMIGASGVMSEIFETIRAVGPSNYTVLITGESGTGKELVAGAIHRESRRKAGPFVPLNCGALPDNILESELFGHVRGAFTGAIRDKKGRFTLADGGTIFLDEIGDLPLNTQAKLLRVLQEKTIEPVGGEKSIRVDVRVVSATNRNLRKMVKEGGFREDLYYRLCVVPLELPPLRERKKDIPLIATRVLEKVCAETGKEIDRIDDEAMRLLISYNWPGNVRELINSLQFASVRCQDERITADHLPLEVRDPVDFGSSGPEPTYRSRSSAPPEPALGAAEQGTPRGRRKLTREVVEHALTRTGGNKLKAAKLLGVGRATLYRFLDQRKENSGH